MTNTDRDLVAKLADELTRQSYSPVVVRNYCAYARDFLAYLAQHEIPVKAVKPSQVAQFLRHAAGNFRKRRGRPPGPNWHSISRPLSVLVLPMLLLRFAKSIRKALHFFRGSPRKPALHSHHTRWHQRQQGNEG